MLPLKRLKRVKIRQNHRHLNKWECDRAASQVRWFR